MPVRAKKQWGRRQGGRASKRARGAGKRSIRGRYVKKQYGRSRPKAIQVATNVPKSVMIMFHVDKTFRVDGTVAGSAPGTSLLTINCNSMNTPMVSASGTWAAQDGEAGDKPDGFGDWLYNPQTPNGGRYQNYAVMGSKITVNTIPTATPAPSTDPTSDVHTEATGGFINNSVIGLHKQTNGRTDILGTTNYMEIQKMPYTSVRNIRGAVEKESGMQGGRITGTYSAKKWEGVSDVKDVKALRGNFTTGPTEGGSWQLFIASREPATASKQHVPQLVRVKVQYAVLLTDPVTNDNAPMKE